MFLKRIFIKDFRALKDVELVFNENFTPTVYPIGSLNGGGKSSLLQLIFSLLKFSFSEEKKDYIRNILSYYSHELTEEFPVADMDITVLGETHNISFSLVPRGFNNLNLDFLPQVESLNSDYEKAAKLEQIYNKITNIVDPTSTDFEAVSSSRLEILKNYLSDYANSAGNKELHREWELLIHHPNKALRKSGTYGLLKTVYQHYLDLDVGQKRVKKVAALSIQKGVLESLEKVNCEYICHIDTNKVLLCKTELNLELLRKISSAVYLAMPASQVLLFLPKKVKEMAFRTNEGSYDYYQKFGEVIRETGVFTYGIESSNIIADAFKSAMDKDFRSALKSDRYGENLRKLKKDLNSFLNDKEITVEPDFSRVVFRLKSTGQALLPEDLSHGELRKLSIFIWLTVINPENSIVLMDEVEIGMHPDWQFSIVNELQSWSKESQFILATHSYELCQAVTPAHVNELKPGLLSKGN